MEKIVPEDITKFIQLSGPLFEAVQQSGIFPDSKTFVDAVPKSSPEKITEAYNLQKGQSDFDLEAFVREHFDIPGEEKEEAFEALDSIWDHIDRLWEYLGRQPDEGISEHSSLIPLPHPYIVPGGRFREIYYWDTYFTAEGLAASGHLKTVENLTRNFAHLIQQVGHIPNGNRYYYLGRSQPPFFVFLVNLLAEHNGRSAIQEFVPALEKEYHFWMEGSNSLPEGQAHRRIVNVDGYLVNRYWDDRPLPREESWLEDVEVAQGQSSEKAAKTYRHLRAGAESGWDYTSRWFSDMESIETIQATSILPADLNALMYAMETKLAEWTESDKSDYYAERAKRRRQACDQLFWNASEGYYFDYNWRYEQQTEVWSLAGVYPLFVGMASEPQAASVAQLLELKFLQEGGVVSSLHDTGQQWDYPNGWAPLQWMAVRGLMNYGHRELARTIAQRWITLNEAVFKRTGKMMEKYNVCDLSLEAGGGEYPLQDGFGWSNGVAVAFKKLLDSGELA